MSTEFSHIKNKYIVIEGNIGSGKTESVLNLSKKLNASACFEEFEINPFLEDFYKGKVSIAYQNEKYFLKNRFIQMTALHQNKIFENGIIADYHFAKSKIFSSFNLNVTEQKKFETEYESLNANLIQPQLILYLHRPIKFLLNSIELRNRHFEKKIKIDYLLKIEKAYQNYFSNKLLCPVVWINCNNADLRSNHSLEYLCSLIEKKYSNYSFQSFDLQ